MENNYQSLTHLTWDFLAGSIPTVVKQYFSLPGVDTLRITLAKKIKHVIEFKTTTSMWNILYLRMKMARLDFFQEVNFSLNTALDSFMKQNNGLLWGLAHDPCPIVKHSYSGRVS